MNLIAQIEAEHIAELAKEIPDFRAGDTIRVGFKVTEGTRTRVQNYEGVCISRKHGKGIAAYSRCTPPISTASPWSAAAACVAPSCTICGIVVVNPHVSSRTHTTKHRRGKSDENRYTSRLPHNQRQNDRRHRCGNEVHMGQRRRPAFAGYRPFRAPCMDRYIRASDGHRRPRIQVQEQVRRSRLLSLSGLHTTSGASSQGGAPFSLLGRTLPAKGHCLRGLIADHAANRRIAAFQRAKPYI